MQHTPMYMFGKTNSPTNKNQNAFTLKAGDTFIVVIKETDEKNRPIPLIGYQITSHVRNAEGDFIADLEVEYANQITKPGEFVLRCNHTQDWDYYKRLFFDIQYINGRTTWSSPTMEIYITQDITKNDVF